MHATVSSAFWTDSRTEELPPEQKLALLWLITNPSRDLCGFTRVTARRFTFETGLPLSALQGACEALPTSFLEVAPGIFFAVNFLRHQFGKGGRLTLKNNVVVAAKRQAEALPEPLRTALYQAYPELLGEASDSSPDSSGKGEGGEAPSHPLGSTPQGVRVRERAEKEQSTPSPSGLSEVFPQGGSEPIPAGPLSPVPPAGVPQPRRDPHPVRTAVQERLTALWPQAARSMTGQELHDLQGSLGVLAELSDDDWTACAAWNAAPERIRGCKLWPRHRSEFVANAGEAVEKIRNWWKRDGRRWWQGRGREVPQIVSTQGTDVINNGDPDALAAFLSDSL